MEPVVASHGRVPGLVTQDRPRAVKEPCRAHRRGRPSPRLPRRTAARYTRMCTEPMLACPALPGESLRGHHAPNIASCSVSPDRKRDRLPSLYIYASQPCAEMLAHAAAAPRGALLYPRLSREGLGGRFLGLM